MTYKVNDIIVIKVSSKEVVTMGTWGAATPDV